MRRLLSHAPTLAAVLDTPVDRNAGCRGHDDTVGRFTGLQRRRRKDSAAGRSRLPDSGLPVPVRRLDAGHRPRRFRPARRHHQRHQPGTREFREAAPSPHSRPTWCLHSASNDPVPVSVNLLLGGDILNPVAVSGPTATRSLSTSAPSATARQTSWTASSRAPAGTSASRCRSARRCPFGRGPPMITPNVPFTFSMALDISALLLDPGFLSLDYGHTLSFASSGPVFNLPGGVTVDIDDVNVDQQSLDRSARWRFDSVPCRSPQRCCSSARDSCSDVGRWRGGRSVSAPARTSRATTRSAPGVSGSRPSRLEAHGRPAARQRAPGPCGRPGIHSVSAQGVARRPRAATSTLTAGCASARRPEPGARASRLQS